MPLTAIGYVADIPLSLFLMPLSLPFKEWIEPNMDYTRVYNPERPDLMSESLILHLSPKARDKNEP